MHSVKTSASKNYQDYLNTALNDGERAAGNIQMALEEKERLQGLLKLTLEDIIKARQQDNNLSESAQIAYDKLAKILDQTDCQEIYALLDLLDTLGLELVITARDSKIEGIS